MSSGVSTVDTAKEQSAHSEQERIRVRAKKVADVVKGVAAAYVGLHLTIATVKLIGRKLRGKEGSNATATRPQQQPSSVTVAPGRQPSAAAAAVDVGEDCWSPVDVAVPAVPDGYRPIVTTVLSCSLQELYGILFSGAGTDLYLKQHRELGKQWDLVASPWRRAPAAAASAAGAPAGAATAADGSLLGQQSVFEWVLGQPGSGGFTRLLTFVNPKKPPNTNDTRCVQRQQFVSYRGGVVLFATAMNMLDIPFRDCFTVNSLWRAEAGAAPGTTALTIHLKVYFIKRAMGVGGIISATTFRDSTAFYTAFTAAVEAHIAAVRRQAAAPLPAPLPATAIAQGGGRLPRSVSRTAATSPFATAAGAVPPLPLPPATAAGRGWPSAHEPLPAWKQLRALLVLAVLVFTLLHQLHLGRELAALRGDTVAAAAAPSGEAGSGGSGGGGSLAGSLVVAALEPLVSAAGSAHWALQALRDRVGGRGPAGAMLPPPPPLQ